MLQVTAVDDQFGTHRVIEEGPVPAGRAHLGGRLGRSGRA
jgi:hypothetical protein